MRRGKQKSSEAASAQIWQHCLNALAKRESGIFRVRSLQKTASEQHEDHQSNAISRSPEMQLNQRSVAPFAANQSRNDVVHRTEDHHREKRIQTEMGVSNTGLGEVDVGRHGSRRNHSCRPGAQLLLESCNTLCPRQSRRTRERADYSRTTIPLQIAERPAPA